MYRLAVLNTHPIQYLAPLYRRLAEDKEISLTVYFCSRQGAEEYFDNGFGERIKWDVSLLEGYDHKFLKNLRRDAGVNGFWSLINFEIVNELRQNSYDALIVHGHSHASDLLAMAAALSLGVPVFMRCETHLLLRRSQLKQVIRKPLMSFLYNRVCSACLPIGTRNRQFYRSHGVSDARLFAVPYAVDNAYFARALNAADEQEALKNSLGLPSEKPLVLFASKLLRSKRPMDLLEAFRRVRDDGIAAALMIVGSGEQAQALKDFVEQHNLRDVHFFGFQNQSELARFYSIADVFVLPAENETWGLAINEVMCAGVPVIATNEIGAVGDLVRNGENGFTYDAGDVCALTRCLNSILASPEMRRQMAEASKRIVEQWNYEHCVKGIKQALSYSRGNSGERVSTLH